MRSLSFVVPAFEEARNLEVLLPRLLAETDHFPGEILVVDDHSSDSTFETVRSWARRDRRIRGVRLSRNGGSYAAIQCGLELARGEAVIVLSSDGQDPPELTSELVRAWQQGAHVVWAVRSARPGETLSTRILSRLYHFAMNRWSDVELPLSGADFFLLDRQVVDAIVGRRGHGLALLPLIRSLGFRQVEIPYVKQARWTGRSKWTMRRKLDLAADSFFGFSKLPLRIVTGTGLAFLVAGIATSILLVMRGAAGAHVRVPAVLAALFASTGAVLIGLGVVGEYVWRVWETIRNEPRFFVEETVNLRDGESPSEGV